MTPQAFSYGTAGNNRMIYIPPYGLDEVIDFMIKINPITYEIKKIPLTVDLSTEKWMNGIAYQNKIYFIPFNEKNILILNTDTDEVSYCEIPVNGIGKYLCGHLFNDKIISLPYGVGEYFDYVLIYDILKNECQVKKINLEINDEKKWHTTQIVNNVIHGVPRGERWEGEYFPYRIEFNCDNLTYKLIDMSFLWKDIDLQENSNKKYTTLAKVDNKLYAPPYSENLNFDVMLKFINGEWTYEHTNLIKTSRKYYSHTVANNKKIYFPPAGHEEDWSEMLIIDSKTDTWYTKELGIGKESKKYFTGVENNFGKIYYIPRGGCVCEPVEEWKSFGDLAEILVIDTKDDSHYTININEYFKDNTTIEKYNNCIIIDNKIFAFPYGESKSFQTLLVFDTLTEEVVKVLDLNDL